MKYSNNWLAVGIVGFVWVISACSSMNIKGDIGENDAGPVEMESVVEIEKPMHFLTASEEDVMISMGTYTVEADEETLRLTSSDQEGVRPITLQVETFVHQEPIHVAEPRSIWLNEDTQVIMMLMPGGKGLQATGSSSGVQARGAKNFKLTPGFLKDLNLPTVNAIFTTPKLGALTPGGTLYIKGTQFGEKGAKSKVVLHFTHPNEHQRTLQIKNWSDTKITVQVPGDISGVADHKVKFQVQNAKGVGGLARKVPFYASRRTKLLKQDDPAVHVVHCSTGADKNFCNALNTSTGGSCFSSSVKSFREGSTIYGRHVNCDTAVDTDGGTDRYAVTLKNGWVFKKVEYSYKKSSGSEKIIPPDYGKLRKTLPGTSSFNPNIKWEVSPGPDQLEYVYWLTIEGPNGIPHY
ncbi:MAG: IPT/TIG domain-containing protein [Nitrospirales bacterium]|nr:IPT/TIG domain-containing protein [Nitrospira sp.]MDR4501508.1 IPT/TIG domain-containing protein [Nitrospirales bacterium]